MTREEFDRRWNAIMRELEGNRMLSSEALQAATDSHTEQHLRSAERALNEKDREIEFLKTVINERDQELETIRADKQFCESNFDAMRSTIHDLQVENRELKNKVKALEAAHELDMKRLARAYQRSPFADGNDERKAAIENFKQRVNNTIRNVTAELDKPVENETQEQKELREFIASVGHLIEGMR